MSVESKLKPVPARPAALGLAGSSRLRTTRAPAPARASGRLLGEENRRLLERIRMLQRELPPLSARTQTRARALGRGARRAA